MVGIVIRAREREREKETGTGQSLSFARGFPSAERFAPARVRVAFRRAGHRCGRSAPDGARGARRNCKRCSGLTAANLRATTAADEWRLPALASEWRRVSSVRLVRTTISIPFPFFSRDATRRPRRIPSVRSVVYLHRVPADADVGPRPCLHASAAAMRCTHQLCRRSFCLSRKASECVRCAGVKILFSPDI